MHPEDGPAPDTEEKMFAAIGRYLDRLVGAVRPRCVLYLAIDGVAPRAKVTFFTLLSCIHACRQTDVHTDGYTVVRTFKPTYGQVDHSLPSLSSRACDHRILEFVLTRDLHIPMLIASSFFLMLCVGNVRT